MTTRKPADAANWTRRWAQLLVGLVLYGIALGFMVRAGIGVAPWDVLGQGIARQTGLPAGACVPRGHAAGSM